MCGITGAIEHKDQSILDFSYGGQSHRDISFRGPDFYNYHVDCIDDWNVSCGHARLSIIDVSSNSNQPMVSSDGRFVLTYNGEIYNYKEIRSELISLGCSFNSSGDTEVLIEAWAKWGINCLNKFNGMFAFTILDRHLRKFFLVRDRFGVKPLLYGLQSNGNLVFSSSIYSVARQVSSDVDLVYCSTGLRYGFFEGNGNLSPFKNVKYVMPGTFLEFSLEANLTCEEHRWYSLETEVERVVSEMDCYSDEEMIARGKELLENATQLRLRSDVPLAVSLSGGIDSSAIAAISKLEVDNLVAFTFGSPTNKYSEGSLVNEFVKKKNIGIRFIDYNYSFNELGDLFDRTAAAQEAPFLGLSVLAQNELCKAVSQHGFRVLLGGQGADESFGGYRKFFFTAAKNALDEKRIPDFLGHLYSMGLLLLNGIGDYKTYWDQRNRYFNKYGRNIVSVNNLPFTYFNLLEHTSLCKRQISDIQNFSLPSLLRYEDRNSMNFSIETRLPFMDYRLIEFALALNDNMKIRCGFGKWALRQMIADNVPSDILNNRVKRGFDVTQNWIGLGVGQRIRTNLLDNKNKLGEYVADVSQLESVFTIENMCKDSKILNEAMILNFLVDPIKNRTFNC
jgi:asparagine synthase (glutamine-hydrolysing)